MKLGLYTPTFLVSLPGKNIAEQYAERLATPLGSKSISPENYKRADERLKREISFRWKFPHENKWVKAGPERLDWAERDTQKLLNDPAANYIASAAFFQNLSPDPDFKYGFYTRALLLHRVAEKTFHILDVCENDGEVTKEDLFRLALQCHLIESCGYHIARAFVSERHTVEMDENSESGQEMWKTRHVSSQVREFKAEAEKSFAAWRDLLVKNPPQRPKGVLLTSTASVLATPDKWKVVERLSELGHIVLADVPKDFSHFNELQKTQIEAQLSGASFEHYDLAGLEKRYLKRKFPAHNVDYETQVVTGEDGVTREIPVLFSNHIVDETGKILKHDVFFCQNLHAGYFEDFADALIASVEQFGGEGSLVTFHKPFEEGCTKVVLEHFEKKTEKTPQDLERIEKLKKIFPRFDDQLDYIKNHVFHTGFKGSNSLKTVYPALNPDVTTRYEDFAIQNGGEQAEIMLKLRSGTLTPSEVKKLREQSISYCSFDTFTMVCNDIELMKKCGLLPENVQKPHFADPFAVSPSHPVLESKTPSTDWVKAFFAALFRSVQILFS
jgi:hypothetical protein